MTMLIQAGALVEHNDWGRGKVVGIDGRYVTVHFPALSLSSRGPRRKLQLGAPQLRFLAAAVDEDFNRLVRRGGVRPKHGPPSPQRTLHDLEQCVSWFQSQFPGLFDDQDLVGRELGYKRAAHRRWRELFGEGRAERLLRRGRLEEIAACLNEVHHATNIPSRFEIMAANDGYKDHAAAAAVLRGVLNFLKTPGAEAFGALTDAVGSLPARGSRPLTWPNATILPFLADPKTAMVVKPQITRRMARRMGWDLIYSSKVTWHCYERVVAMADALLERLGPLGAKDFIDVQSFMWVTQDLE